MLLLDESFAGLNPSEQNELIDIIRKMQGQGDNDHGHRTSYEGDHVPF